MEPAERVAASSQLPAGGSQSVGQISTDHMGAQSPDSTTQEQKQHRVETDGWERQQTGGYSLQLEFQDSNLSPALSLLPGGEYNITEYSLFQQSDTEFVPLRAYPDVSVASERFHFSTQDHTTHVSEHESLSQHPLAHETILSEEGGSSCSLSQHSLSPGGQRKQSVITHADEKQEILSVEYAQNREEDTTTHTSSSCNIIGEAADDEIYFLRKDVPAQHLLDLLQKDVSVPSSRSSVVSSDSEPSVKRAVSFREEATSKKDFKLASDQSLFRREGPPGEASLPQQTRQSDQSRAHSSEIANITMGSRSTEPDESSELLHRELLSEVQKRTNQQRSPTPPVQVFTPYPKEMPEGKHVQWTGPFSVGLERLHREQDLWSSGNQTGIDGSYLGFLPQSQSTPGVFKAPSKSSVKAKLGQLSAIESNNENSYQSSTGVSSQPAPPVAEDRHLNTENQGQEDPASAKVQSLPTLNYMQKVDAWRANQSSDKTSLFDSLALQGFSGISPKKKAYDAVSDTLNRILSQRARSLQQPIVSGNVKKNVTQGSSTTPSGSSSPRRGEAVGSAPSDKDNTGSAAAASPSPFGRSQSHSSLSTVLSIHKDQQTDKLSEKEKSQVDAGATVQPCPLMSLGHFSDVSLDQDTTFSSSQDSYSEMKLGTSVGASSGVSLELDHYAPYWTSKLSTPPPLAKPRELNIDERIPLYLHNLGIDQSPSTILTPFAPRGPIREPEFSPTDICTIKGSTPTKSTQPSEGSSPHKGECSRSSLLSVDSSMSMSVSLDSLAPAVSVLERARATSPPSDAEAIHSERRLAPSSLPDEDSLSYIPEQQDSSAANSQNMRKLGEDSFVSSKALLEIRKLLSQAENMISTGSSAASSSSPTAPHLLSDDDIFLSLRRSSRVQETSFSSSSNAEDPQSRSSRLWARSSSDSMLTSDKQRQSSIGQDTHKNVQDSTVSSGAGASLLLSNSARRTEPEGCSAAPPDKVPTRPPHINPPAATATQQLTSTPTDTDGVPQEEDENAVHEGTEQSSSSSPITEDADQGGMSDVSSESSLAVRVVKLLQNESPATMVSSTPSVTDQEESKAREWIKLKVSGQQCEPLELDKEDRERIEEIKRELLLKNPIKSQGSTDTESSAASSVRVLWGHNPPHVSSDANNQRTQLLQGLSVKLPDSITQLQNVPRTDLEARVNEIAAKEGVTLSAQKPRPLTSITIATCRRSTSPSPSTSPAPPLSPTPEPLHLTELSTGPVKPPTTNRLLPSNLDEQDRVVIAQTQTRELSVTSQKRQDTMGGQLEKPVSPLQGLDQEDVTVTDESTKALKRDVAVGPGVDQATSSGSPARTGHVSHVHFTLSPKTTEHPVTVSVHSSHADALSGQPRKDFVPLRHFSSAASSPDEGVGLSSPPEWCDTRVAVRQRVPERSDTTTMFKTPQPKGRTTTVSTSHHRSDMSPRCFNSETPVPVLLPYKPHGSEELFYVPQTEADVSSTELSDTSMESSHPGSDDAVPPRFSSEVLGHQDPGLDRGVTIRHVEGIYSKRLKTATFKMQEPGCRDPPATVDQSAQTVTQKPKISSPAAFTGESLSTNQEAFRRDQGTSQVYFQRYDQPEPDFQTSGSQTGRESRGTGTLDQLWQKFCDQWATEESRPISDRETSLLERLERLSRLIHSSGAADVSEESGYHQEHRRRREDRSPGRKERKDFGEVMRSLHGEARKPEPVIHQRLQVEGRSQPAVDDSHTSSSFSHSSSHSLHFSPAEKDESEILSTTSGSMSTVDTARLVRAFGAHRVQHLKTSSSLSKLYSTINKQREGREQRRGRNRDSPDTLTPPETSITDNSVAADSASSASTYILPSRTLAAKKAVKLVNKGVQAGDLEIVSNGTRRHTRDVGTTFPSPGEGRAFERTSSSSASRARGGQRGTSKTQGTPKQRKSKRSPSKNYPEGISWFISADDLRSEARKENQEQETCRPSTAWFEPYSKTSPWREPLRQRQVHEDRNRQTSATHAKPDADPRTKPVPSGLARVSLQDALEMHRPEFISRSQHRVKCLNLQAEERRLQAVFNRERDKLFNQPGGPAARLPRPAGTAQVRRAVPRKEMIQRSKQIYENLPEVQRRKEEERRRAEYRSYRLNAQLYNKRITNRVLGRRSAWH